MRSHRALRALIPASIIAYLAIANPQVGNRVGETVSGRVIAGVTIGVVLLIWAIYVIAVRRKGRAAATDRLEP